MSNIVCGKNLKIHIILDFFSEIVYNEKDVCAREHF